MDPTLKRIFDRHAIRSRSKAIATTLGAFLLIELAAFLLTNAGDSTIEHLIRTSKFSGPAAVLVALFAFGNHLLGVRQLRAMLSAPDDIRWAYGTQEVDRIDGKPTRNHGMTLRNGKGDLAHVMIDDAAGALMDLRRWPNIMLGYGPEQQARYDALVAAKP
jgi:hypothetical protein